VWEILKYESITCPLLLVLCSCCDFVITSIIKYMAGEEF
jgi:hypothetical protein